MDWQDIETAPKDGSRVLAYGSNGWRSVSVSTWTGRYWECEGDIDTEYDHAFNAVWNPTHWQPLPEPPSQAETKL